MGKWTWLYRQSDPAYLDAYHTTSRSLAKALVERLATLWEGRGDYEQLSAGALASANGPFHPDKARRRLEEIYESFR